MTAPGWLSLSVDREGPLRYRWTVRSHDAEVTGLCLTRDQAARRCAGLARQATER